MAWMLEHYSRKIKQSTRKKKTKKEKRKTKKKKRFSSVQCSKLMNFLGLYTERVGEGLLTGIQLNQRQWSIKKSPTQAWVMMTQESQSLKSSHSEKTLYPCKNTYCCRVVGYGKQENSSCILVTLAYLYAGNFNSIIIININLIATVFFYLFCCYDYKPLKNKTKVKSQRP